MVARWVMVMEDDWPQTLLGLLRTMTSPRSPRRTVRR